MTVARNNATTRKFRLPLPFSTTPLHRTMPIAAWLFIFTLLLAAGLMFCAVFFVRASGRSTITDPVVAHLSELPCLQVIMFSELEQQLISEEHLCDTLNNVRPPSFASQTMMK
jgi:hypothetical protein